MDWSIFVQIAFDKFAETPSNSQQLKPLLEWTCDKKVMIFFPLHEIQARCALERDFANGKEFQGKEGIVNKGRWRGGGERAKAYMFS